MYVSHQLLPPTPGCFSRRLESEAESGNRILGSMKLNVGVSQVASTSKDPD